MILYRRDLELSRLRNIASVNVDSSFIPIDDYFNRYSFEILDIIPMSCTIDTKVFKDTYFHICDTYGEIPIEIARVSGKYETPFIAILQSKLINSKKIAVYAN